MFLYQQFYRDPVGVTESSTLALSIQVTAFQLFLGREWRKEEIVENVNGEVGMLMTIAAGRGRNSPLLVDG